MPADQSTLTSARNDRFERLAPVAAGFLALLPFLIWHRQFAELFWMGDEFDQLDLIDRHGFWNWLWIFFGENQVPLFKLFWGGGVFFFRGDYLAMLWIVWLTHALNIVLLGRVMRAYGFPWVAVFFTQAVIALSSTNIEMLGWSVQWSALLATTFTCLALEWHARMQPQCREFSWRVHGTLMALSAAAVFSHSRFAHVPPILALACFWPLSGQAGGSFSRRMRAAAWGLAPGVVAIAVIMTFANGNHQHLRGHVGESAVFGLWYFGQNPFFQLLGLDSWGPKTLMALTALKIVVVVWGFQSAHGAQRMLLGLLLVFELGNAVILGVGRYHTGLGATVISRYQYCSQIATLPFAGLCLANCLKNVSPRFHARSFVTAMVPIVVACLALCQWPEDLRPFVAFHGTDNRRVMLREPNPGPFAIPGIDFMPTSRGRELIKKYNLH